VGPGPAAARGLPAARRPHLARRHGALQAARLLDAGLAVHQLPVLRDVDTVQDALAVAALAPSSRFAAVLAPMLDLTEAG
jgi:hypothetical protein